MKIRAFCLCWLIAFSCSNVLGQTDFDGDVSTDWTVAENWNNDTLPDVGTNVFIGTGSPDSPSGIVAEIFDGSVFYEVNDVRLGAFGADGTLNISAGTLVANGWGFLGVDGNGGTATLNLSGTGVYEQPVTSNDGNQEFHVGFGASIGGSTPSTAIVNISDDAELRFSRGWVGSNAGNIGIVNQTGGTVTVNQWMGVGRSEGAQGTYNMSGGVASFGNELSVGDSGGASGTVHLSGDANMTIGGVVWIGRGLGDNGGDGSSGALIIEGSQVTFEAAGFLAFGNDGTNPQNVTGTLQFIADADGVSSITTDTTLILNDGLSQGAANLEIDLTGQAEFGDFADTNTLGFGKGTQEIILVETGGGTISTFANVPGTGEVSIGGGKTGILNYAGGPAGLDLSVFVEASNDVLIGDVNCDGVVDLLDVQPFVDLLTSGGFSDKADINGDGAVDLLDVAPFVELLAG